jgi:uncharacterized protein
VTRSLLALVLLSSLAPAQVVISQVYGGGGATTGTPTYQYDYVELFNPTSAAVDISGWTVRYASSAGTSWSGPSVGTKMLQPGEYFLVRLGTAGTVGAVLPTADLTGAANMSATAGKVVLVRNSTTTFAGVACPTGTDVADFAPYGTAANCSPQVTGTLNNASAAVRDAAGCGTAFSIVAGAVARNSGSPFNVCGGAGPLQITGVTPSGTVGAAYSATLGAAGGTGTYSWLIAMSPAGSLGTLGLSPSTGASTTVSGTPAGPGTVTVTLGDGATTTTRNFAINAPFSCTVTHTIMQIQGSGAETPLAANTNVTVRGVVTGLISNGYFIQDATGDGNGATSDGLFIFTSTAPAVVRGNDVCVNGPVVDFVSSTDNAARLTEITTPNTTTVLNASVALPVPVTLTSSNPSAFGVFDQLENLEGMRVTIPVATVVQPAGGTVTETTAISSLNGEIYVTVQGATRPFKDTAGIDQPANIVQTVPSVINIPVTVPRPEGGPQRIFVDFNRQTGGPAPLDVSVGQTVTGLTGVLHYLNRTYSLLPDPGTTPVAGGTAPSAPSIVPPTADQITVASFNMERLFPAGVNGVQPTAYANRLNKLSLAIRNTLQSPDVIAVQEANGTALIDLAAKLNADALPATPGYVGALAPTTNDPGGIAVGFVYKGSRISNVTLQQFGLTDTFVDPRDNVAQTLNDRPPFLLSATARRSAAHLPFRFSVLVNHLRSNIGLDQPNLNAVADLVSQGVYVRKKRLGQALFTAALIQSRQVANPAEPLIVLGDFNALNVSDGWADLIGTLKGTPAAPAQVVLSGPINDISPALGSTLVTPALTNLMDLLPAGERYSYVFRGNAQVLDSILVNPNAQSQYAQIQVGRGNADYSESFRNISTRPERISDHDIPVATFNLPANTLPAGLAVLRGGLFYNTVTGVYTQTLTVRNITSAPIAGPLVLVLSGITTGWTWTNRDGNLAGAEYKNIPASTIPAGGTSAVSISWTRVGTTALNYTMNVATAN